MDREEPLGIQRGAGSEYSPELESPFASGQDRGEEDAEEHHRDAFDTLLDIGDAKNVMEDVELGPMLGTGSYGKVYLGRHAFHGNVAVKVIPIQSCTRLRKFDMEVKTGLDVRHANVAVLHEWRVVHTKYYVSNLPDGLSSFCNKASSSHGPDARYQRLQGLRHCFYLSNCSAGFSRMSSSNGSSSSSSSSNCWAQEAPAEMQDNGCDCNICSNAWTELWLIQELCPLGTLSKAIERRWFAEIGQEYSNKVQSVVKIALDIAKGVAALHDRNIMHGDLSSNNVMLACDGVDEVEDEICLNPWTVDVTAPSVLLVAKLIDFGSAKSIQPWTQHTESLCTLPYMSPEMMSDGTVTPAADTYSFGVLVWELWTNVLAWCGILPAQIIVQRSMGNGLDIPLDAPAELQQLMRDCLAEDGHMRPLMSEVISRLTSMQP